MPRFSMMEELESRTLLSASHGGIDSTLSLAVKADRIQVQIDLLKFRSDCDSLGSTFLADVTNIKKDAPKTATTVVPLLKQMRTDIATMHSSLHTDRLAQDAAVLADQSVILKEQLQIIKDHGNPTAVAADRKVLIGDRITLQGDMIAGLDARIGTRQAAYSTLIADGNAVVAAATTDPNATPKLQADLTKWTTDRSTGMTTLIADLQKIVADRTQLVTDLTAMQSA